MYLVPTETTSSDHSVYKQGEIVQDSGKDTFHDILECTECFDYMELEDRESVPGAWHVAAQVLGIKGETYKIRTDLEVMDVRMVNELGRLSSDDLFSYLRSLQSWAFNLKVEERNQFNIGKILRIFDNIKK